MGLLEGLSSDGEARQAVEHFRNWPVLANCVTGGKSPLWTAGDAQKLGFKLAIFPTASIYPVAAALKASYARLVQLPTQSNAAPGIDIEAETDESLVTVNLGGADPCGLPNFFNDMSLQEEVYVDTVASGKCNSRRLGVFDF